MSSLLDAIKAGPPPKPPEIIIDRSALEAFMSCPLRFKLRKEQPIPDADRDRMALVGVEFHSIMEQYISELLADNERHNTENLVALASGGDARFQPDLVHCAHLTGPRVTIWATSYISHEKQYAYRLPKFGPRGEDVLLTCRPDLVTYGSDSSEVIVRDWKTGFGKTGFGFQSMFYSVVVWKAHEGIERIAWQPFFCRFGRWGKRDEYDVAQMAENENIIKTAVIQYLQEEDYAPNPGGERCRWCEYHKQCPVNDSYFDIDDTPTDYLQAYIKLGAGVKAMKKKLDAKAKATGPICLDGQWYGADPIRDRVTYRLNKGSPGYIGEEDEGESE